MQPHRTRLPEDADEAAALHRPLVHAAAAGSWRPAA
jgi:hypothetical protein